MELGSIACQWDSDDSLSSQLVNFTHYIPMVGVATVRPLT